MAIDDYWFKNAVFAPEPHMQLYGRGIRRRLAPMLGNEAQTVHLKLNEPGGERLVDRAPY